MKLMVYSDTQVGLFLKSKSWKAKQSIAFFKELGRMYQERMPDYVVGCGDLFESAASVDAVFVADLLTTIHDAGIPSGIHFVIPGNHDWHLGVSILGIMSGNASVFQSVHRSGSLMFLPFNGYENIREILGRKVRIGFDVVVSHFEVGDHEKQISSDLVCEYLERNRACLALLGHRHERGWHPGVPIYNVGSSMEHDVSEAGYRGGVAIANVVGGTVSMEHVFVDVPRFRVAVVGVGDVDNFGATISHVANDKDFYHVKLVDSEARGRVEDVLAKAVPRENYCVEDVGIEVSSVGRNVEVSSLRDSRWIEECLSGVSVPSKLNRDRVLRRAESLLKRARSSNNEEC